MPPVRAASACSTEKPSAAPPSAAVMTVVGGKVVYAEKAFAQFEQNAKSK